MKKEKILKKNIISKTLSIISLTLLLAISTVYSLNKPIKASARGYSGTPNFYHYQPIVYTEIDGGITLGGFSPNSYLITNYTNGSISLNDNANGCGISMYHRNTSVYSTVCSAINGNFSGDSSQTVYDFFNLTFLCAPFTWLPSGLLSMGVSASDIQNGYAVFLSSNFVNYISSVRVYYDYQFEGSSELLTVDESILYQPKSIILNSFPNSIWQYLNTYATADYIVIDPFIKASTDPRMFEELYSVPVNIYNFKLTINFNGQLTGQVADDYEFWFGYPQVQVKQEFVPSSVGITDINWFDSVVNSVNSILSIEILPEISFYDILIVALVIPILIWILKSWLGG